MDGEVLVGLGAIRLGGAKGDGGLLHILGQALAGEAQVLSDMGRNKESTMKHEAAQNVVDEIAVALTDEELRRLYLENAALRVAVGQ